MLKNMRRLCEKAVSFMLAAIMVISLMPITALADTEGNTANNPATEVVKLWIKYGEEDYKITDTQWTEIVTKYEKTYYASANHRSTIASQEEFTGVALEDIFAYLELDTTCLSGDDKVTFRDYTGGSMTKMTVDQVFNMERYAYKASVDENGDYILDENNEVAFLEEGKIESPIFIKTNDEGENGGRLIVSMAYAGEFSKQYWWSNVFGSATNPLTAATIEIPATAIKTGFESGTGTSDDPYIIKTAEQMKNLADKVNAGNTYEGKYFKLANDIDLTTLKDAEGNTISWTPIGGGDILTTVDADGYDQYTPSNKFYGTFDGAGYTINLAINAEEMYVGLFGHNGGTLKNFTVTGTINVTGTKEYVGAAAGFNSGTITRVINKATINAPDCYHVGGIAGVNVAGNWKYCVEGSDTKSNVQAKNAVGLITECGNEGKLTGLRVVGGIAGGNYGTISYCYNYGDIDFWWEGSMSKIGGITGFCADTGDAKWAPGHISNCYNTGYIQWINTVQSSRGYAGIVCFIGPTSSITNCYNIGAMKKGYSDQTPICPRYDSNLYIKNNYSLDTIEITYMEDLQNEYKSGKQRSEEEFKSADFLAEIGGAYTTDTNNINNGFPVLKWQNGVSTEITKLECETTQMDFVEGQIFNVSGLTVYAVYSDGSKELIPGQNLTANKTSAFTMEDDGSVVTVSYAGKSLDIQVNIEQKSLDYIYVYTKPTKYVYKSGDAFDPTGMKIRAFYANTLLSGTEKYTDLDASEYTINAPATLTEANNKVTVFYTLNGKISSVSFEVVVVDEGTAPTKDANGAYQLSTVDDLLWYAKQVNYFGNTSLNAILTADIDASSVAWMPIGISANKTVTQNILSADGVNSSKTLTYAFTNVYGGTFDGNGKSITINAASDILGNQTSVGTFGRTSAATIKNLTVKGQVSGTNYVAGIVAYDGGNTTISNCVNEAAVTGSTYTAGILGYSRTGTVTDCTNKGLITATGNNYVGGIAAYATNISGCVNEGNVSANNAYNVGGIVGYGYTKGVISNCANLGNIQAKYDVGGIYGTGYASKIENCYNKGNVTATALSTTKGAGGIVGTKHASYALDVVNCYNAGTISTTGSTKTTVGELVGYAAGTASTKYLALTNCYYLGSDDAKAVGAKGSTTTVNDASAAKSLAELSAMAETLGAAYQNSCGGAVLTYQTAAEHTWGDWADDTATFTEAGIETRTCTVCGSTETRATEATGVVVTEAAIDRIGDVTLESKAFIDAARSFYNKLTDAQKAEVDNYDTLVAAEAEYAALKAAADQAAADAAAANGVEAAIEAIGEVTLESKEAIDGARAAYDTLTDAQKAFVDNYEILTAAEIKYDELLAEKAAADEAAANEVEALIEAIGEVTLESKANIDVSRAAYEALTDDQKELVSNVETLETAESVYSELEAAAEKAAVDEAAANGVKKLIAEIGEVTLDKETVILKAVSAFNALTDDQKKLVENVDILKEAVVKLAALNAENEKAENNTTPSTGDATPVALFATIIVISLFAGCLLIKKNK